MLLAVSKGAGPAGVVLVQAFTLRWAPLTEVDSPPDAMSLICFHFKVVSVVSVPMLPPLVLSSGGTGLFSTTSLRLHKHLPSPSLQDLGMLTGFVGHLPAALSMKPCPQAAVRLQHHLIAVVINVFLYSELGCEFCAHNDKRASLTGTVSSSAVVSGHLEDSLQGRSLPEGGCIGVVNYSYAGRK